MKTNFEGLEIDTTPNVYEPLEDSFLLARLVRECARGKVLDVGTGSGLQAIVAAKNKEVSQVLALDLNPEALEVAAGNAKKNGVSEKMQVRKSDLFSALSKDEVFDCIIFNPPYLPTAEDEKLQREINLAFDGGPDGRKEIDRFLEGFGWHLSRNGLLLLVQSSLADENKTLAILQSAGFDARVVSEEKFFFERILAIRAERK
ncbi:MAG: HemK2/MTQ2 family protein methyltransferase [Candidatus Micrarchaeia archaeon]|jgi:release factor glutamine methyltransferase